MSFETFDLLIDDRTTWHSGYVISKRKRERVEEVSGWFKTVGSTRDTRHRELTK